MWPRRCEHCKQRQFEHDKTEHTATRNAGDCCYTGSGIDPATVVAIAGSGNDAKANTPAVVTTTGSGYYTEASAAEGPTTTGSRHNTEAEAVITKFIGVALPGSDFSLTQASIGRINFPIRKNM